MKFSDAMREGAKQGGQLFHMLRGPNGSSCAMGAVMVGKGGPVGACYYPALEAEYPFLREKSACPACDKGAPFGVWSKQRQGRALAVIVHLNNDHRWTREKIADWIEHTYESDLIPAAQIREFCGMVPA